MTPTLRGRLQTRVVVAGTVGSLWAALITPLLPRPDWAGRPPTLGAMYAMAFGGLALVVVAGLLWELVYHALQQLRWDKDWPSLFALVTAVNEGASTWVLLHGVGVVPGPLSLSSPFFPAFAVLFGSTWLVLWLFLQGPIRVIAPRWRYRGGAFF